MTSHVPCATGIPAPIKDSQQTSVVGTQTAPETAGTTEAQSLRRRLGLGVGEGGCLGFVCLLFLMSSEEYHFLLKASLCFYAHSKTAVPRKEAAEFKGRQERRWPASERGILEACGQCFDDKREGMFPPLPDASSSTLHQRARVWGRKKLTLGWQPPSSPSLTPTRCYSFLQ